MLMQKKCRFPVAQLFAAACFASVLAPAARAQWAVVDVPATIQLVQEVMTATEQLETLKSELQQAEQTLQSMSGGRGMQALLGGQNRNRIPNFLQLVLVNQSLFYGGMPVPYLPGRRVLAAACLLFSCNTGSVDSFGSPLVFLIPQPVQRNMRSDPKHPGRKLRRRLIRCPRPENPQENLLRQFLRGPRVLDHSL